MRPAGTRITACVVALVAASPLLGVGQEIASYTVLLQQDRGRPASPLERHVTVHLRDVSLAQALRTLEALGGVRVSFSSDIVPVTKQVSVDLDDGTLREAFRRVLEGTGLEVLVQAGDHLVLVKAPSDPVQGGTVTGRVTDAKTQQPIAGASVALASTRWRATTDQNGQYRIAEVAPGMYTLTASRIGYAKQAHSVTVAAEQEVTADVALQAAPTELEQVVVTGTVTPTERKAVPTPISVITADQIEQRGYQRVDQIFRGDVPGAIAWDPGILYAKSDINIRGASNVFFGDVKTYIDGVEVADPLYVATIDPSSVERIEVVRGPQGTTIYGSEALNGVMQIFTKKGEFNSPQPQIDAKVSMGLVQSRWANSTVAQDHSVAVTGGGPDFSYRLGGGYVHQGEWTPEYYTDNASLYGSVRGTQGPVTIGVSARYYSKTFGEPLDPRFHAAGYTYYSKPLDETIVVPQQTYGITLKYAPNSSWQQNLILGYDRTGYDNYFNHPRFTTPADSFVFVESIDQAKASVAYNSTYFATFGPTVQSSLTVGADHWAYHEGGSYKFSSTSNSNTISSPDAGFRVHYENTGYFVQGQVGLRDAMFLTAGVRAEDNQNFGKDFGLAWAPRVGVSYVHAFGDITAKGRVAYGKAIRPPAPGSTEAAVTAFFQQLANTDLKPEQQVGADGGLELYFSRRGSLEVTYYRQFAKDLIDQVLVNASTTPPTYQYQNVGQIKNSGWELGGRLKGGRLSLTATYSITSSVVERLSPTYTGALQPGDQMLHIPKYSGGATLSYGLPRTTVALGVTSVSSWTETDWLALYGFYYGGQPYRGSPRAYWITYPGFTKLNLSVSHGLTDRLSVFVQSDNLTNSNAFEKSNLSLTPGRITTIGARAKM